MGGSHARWTAPPATRVAREYYINDAGRQMEILAVSLWLRYLEACGETLAFPADGYRGDYVQPVAALLREPRHGRGHHLAVRVVVEPAAQRGVERHPQHARRADLGSIGGHRPGPSPGGRFCPQSLWITLWADCGCKPQKARKCTLSCGVGQ